MNAKEILTTILFIMWGFTGYFIGRCWDNKDELNNLRIQNSFLHDYRKAYMEHIIVCDTLHQQCFRTKP